MRISDWSSDVCSSDLRLRRSLKILAALAGLAVILAIAGAGGVLYIFYEYGRGLPDYGQLADYEPPTVTRVHAGDGRLLAEYATEKRVFVPMEAIPRRVVNAFLSAEDQNFYDHRSEEHTSELQSLMRISYAVFC